MPPPTPAPGARAAGWRCLGLWTLVLTALAVLFTWPAAIQVRDHLFGGPRDGPMFLWNFWWGTHAVLDLGQSPFWTDLLFHPGGASLVVNSHVFGPAVLSAPLQLLFGPVAAMNLWVLGTFVLAGLGAALLAHEIVPDRRAALVAGVAFAFGHHRVSMVMFLNLIQSQFLVLYVWALWAAWRRRSLALSAWAGVLAAVTFYSSYNLLVMALLFSAGFAVHAILAGGHGTRRGHAGRWLVTLGVFAVLGAPLGLALKEELSQHGNYLGLESEKAEVGVPLSRYLVRGGLADAAQDHPLREASYLGWATLVLAGFGIAGRRRRSETWLLVALCLFFVAASLGQSPSWSGDGQGPERAWAPFAWLRRVPLIQDVRVAHRYGILATLALAPLAGMGAAWILERLRGRRRLAWAAAVLMPGLVFLDFLDPPFARLYRLPEPPAALARIAEDAREVCVLEFPAGRRGYKAFSYYETLHRKPVYLEGQIARRQPHLEERQQASRALQILGRVFEGRSDPEQVPAAALRAIQQEAREHRIGWLVLSFLDYESMADDLPVPERRIQDLQALARRAFPVEEVLYEVAPEAADGFNALGRRERLSTDGILGIYRLTVD